jgi:hypothetical protein
MNITIYFANRSPIKAISSNKTPQELFHSSKFIYKYLCIFACAAYALNHQAKKAGKMALRSEKYWLLNYNTTTIFRLWDPIRKYMYISRDIIFNEAELIRNISVRDLP